MSVEMRQCLIPLMLVPGLPGGKTASNMLHHSHSDGHRRGRNLETNLAYPLRRGINDIKSVCELRGKRKLRTWAV